MAFDLDTGPAGSEGPWLNWSARGTQDGTIPARSFYVNDKDKNKTKTDAFTKGVVLDIDTMKTGWQEDGGVGMAPKWTLGASPSRLPERPSDDAKKGFQIRCAIGGGAVADWNQAGAGAWGAIADLGKALAEGSAANPNKLPVVVIESIKELKFKMGSTAQPVLKVVKWVDRPDCLKGDGVQIDKGEPETPPADSAAVSDEIAF